MFNRLRVIWLKGYQRGSLGKSHQNGDYLKQAMRKSCLPAGIEPAAFFTLLVLSSRRSGGSSVGFRAGRFRPDST